MWFFTYLRLKLTVSFSRFILRWKIGWKPLGRPDEILRVKSSDPSRKKDIKVNVYRPANISGPAPVLINFHGSGFVFPLHGSDDAFCRQISQQTNYVVLDVQYRLAPEHPWPAAHDDAADVVRYVLDRSEEFDRSRVSLSGFSAGGNIALVSSSTAFPQGTFCSVLAFYPPTNLSIDPSSKIAPDSSGKPIPPSMARTFDQCYIPPGADTKDPRISPYFVDAEKFPDKVMILTAACDSLALEAEALAAKIEEVPGKQVIRKRFEKVNHAWDKLPKEGSVAAKARDEAYAMAAETLRQ